MLEIYFYFSAFTVLKVRANLILIKLKQKVWVYLVFLNHPKNIFSKHILSLYDS